MEELIENLRLNNGEFVTAIVLLMSLLQEVSVRFDDPKFTESVNSARDFIKNVGIATRRPPGCRLDRFDELPPQLRAVVGEGWREFFNQPTS